MPIITELMGRPQLALKELEEAYAGDRNNLKVLDSLAHLYEDLGHFDRAQKLYQEALSRHDANPALHNNLCFSYYLAGRWEQAEACFRQALDRDPGNVAARNNLGLLYCRLGKREEARRLWREAEGEAAAEQKVNLALAALGMSAPAAYAQSNRRAPEQHPVQATAKTQQPRPAAAVQAPSQPAERLAKRLEVAAKPGESPRAETPRPEAAAPRPTAETGKKTDAVTPVATRPAAVTAIHGALQPSQVRPQPLNAAELEETAIEVRNGTRTRNLAHRTRSLLSQEGFTVTRIGNHIDFGAKKTVIYYRPGADRVARSLGRDFFPTSKMEQSLKLRDDVDVKILLGHDLLNRHGLMAHRAETPRPVAAAPRPTAETGKKNDAVTPVETKPTAPTAIHGALQPSQVRLQPLSAAELEETAIEVRNGTRTRNLAHRSRSLLSQQGFTVTRIGNHIDFGAEKTVIYYRPEAERVARALGRDFFPTSTMEQSLKLRDDVDVKILLGHDLLNRHGLMAQLAGEGK